MVKEINIDIIMLQVQVFVSVWLLVGGIFDDGYVIENVEEVKVKLCEMLEDFCLNIDLQCVVELFVFWYQRGIGNIDQVLSVLLGMEIYLGDDLIVLSGLRVIGF